MSEFLDRKLTLSSNSLHFLRRHDFDVEKAMTVGVPYLSREERRLVMNSSGRIETARD